MKPKFFALVCAVLLVNGFARTDAPPVHAAPEAIFTVNQTADLTDANVNDGRCDTSTSSAGDQCSLRAAIQQANATPGTDTITFLSSAVHKLTLVGNDNSAAVGDLDIQESLTILGHAPQTTIDSDTGDSVFQVQRFHTVTFENLVITGGGIGVKGKSGALAFNNVTFSENSSGAVQCNCLVTFEKSSKHGQGPGITANRVNIVDSQILGNSGNTAVSIEQGNSSITRSAIRGHSAGVANGGGSLLIRDSEISGNSGASFDIDIGLSSGGGITHDSPDADTTIVNSTLSGNGSALGGAISASTGTLRLFNATVVNNFAMEACDPVIGACEAGETGGILGSAEVTNSIIANNSSAFTTTPDCAGTLESSGFNLIGNTTGCSISGTTTGNVLNVNPGLGPLASNGGPTKTHGLLRGSPAIDAGNTGGCRDQSGVTLTTDQRGFTRPTDGDGDFFLRCEIGAFEVGAVGIGSVSPNKGNSDPGELVVFDLAWDSPTRWRDLTTLDLRFKRQKDILLWLRFTEGLPTSTISLLDEDGSVLDSGNVGEAKKLKNKFGSIDLSQSGFTASGPDDPHVVVHFAVKFKRKAEGKSKMQMLATDDFGNEQGPEPAGQWKVK